MITFIEHKDASYNGRTWDNASADATIAIATRFESAGEILTKRYVKEQKKVYIPVDISKELDLSNDTIKRIANELNLSSNHNVIDTSITLNIAGNGIYTMKGFYSQEVLDEYVYKLLKTVFESSHCLVSISLIRSGGQTGLDEAGAKAGVRLGIPTLIVCPKGWKFRNLKGEDIANEEQFKARFL